MSVVTVFPSCDSVHGSPDPGVNRLTGIGSVRGGPGVGRSVLGRGWEIERVSTRFIYQWVVTSIAVCHPSPTLC